MDLELERYLGEVSSGLQAALSRRLLGFYVFGSTVTGSFVPGKSDMDALALVAGSLGNEEIERIRGEVAGISLPSVIRGLDLSIASDRTVAHLTESACWEMMLQVSAAETGQHVVERERCDPRLPLDLALARQEGIPIVGPPVREVVARVPRKLVLRACTENVRVWAGRDAFRDPASGVLNACRAWQYLEGGTLGSKVEGGQWALGRGGHRHLLDAALAQHRGEEHRLPPDAEIKRFFQTVLGLLEAAGP